MENDCCLTKGSEADTSAASLTSFFEGAGIGTVGDRRLGSVGSMDFRAD